jgi:VWFA-related protein
VLVASVALGASTLTGASADDPLTVHITSPLGRTGTPGLVRIVARIAVPSGATLHPVRFLIDGTLFKVDDDGPPYAVEWVDDNPFERREIAVEAEDSEGHQGRDTVVLTPFEVAEKTQVFSVVIDATVRDKTGRFVTGLGPSNFVLQEDDTPQHPDLVHQESLPATFALLVDSSNSMTRRFDFVRDAASTLVSYLRPRDRVIVAPFSLTLSALTGPTSDRETIVGAIGAIKAGGGTAIFDGLRDLADRIAPMEGRHDIILITDGYDENSHATFREAVEAVKRSASTVYILAIGGVAGISLRGERELKQLAVETGGRAFFPPRIQDLPLVYDQLAVDAQNRYLLGYTPTNQRQNGSWRDLSVTTTSPQYVVVARDGYYAPEAPPVRPAIEFTVIDDGDHYLDVTSDDLLVREDGVEQQIDTFTEADDPIQIVLTLDQSGSMKRSAEAVKAAASEFVRALRPGDPLALITFADTARFAHDLSTTREWSLDAIEHYETKGGTALYDALYDSIMRLRSEKGRLAVVVLTDGRDENDPGTAPGSVHTLPEVFARAYEVGAAIYPIGLGPNVDRAVLAQLAEISGGHAYFPADVTQLSGDYHKILENLRRRYVLGYASSNRERDGRWRKVEIIVRSTGVPVKSRGGYYAPEK